MIDHPLSATPGSPGTFRACHGFDAIANPLDSMQRLIGWPLKKPIAQPNGTNNVVRGNFGARISNADLALAV